MSNPPSSPLSEKNFIQDDIPKKNFPFWMWLFLLTMLVCLLWGTGTWYSRKMALQYQEKPFLRVTNRDFSLFLWQFPEYMRIYAKNKSGYLPGFQYEEKVTANLAFVDDYVVAPPELLFLYHTWNRLISAEFIQRSILINDFKKFLSDLPEWQPENWAKAPKGYVTFIKELSTQHEENLADLPEGKLPLVVRMAFQGWKNYTQEGTAINEIKPTYEKMKQFLNTHPHYARNYWRNILWDSYPHYLETLFKGIYHAEDAIPKDQLAPFLKVSYYNNTKLYEVVNK